MSLYTSFSAAMPIKANVCLPISFVFVYTQVLTQEMLIFKVMCVLYISLLYHTVLDYNELLSVT